MSREIAANELKIPILRSPSSGCRFVVPNICLFWTSVTLLTPEVAAEIFLLSSKPWMRDREKKLLPNENIL
jgi:hypothetical protein